MHDRAFVVAQSSRSPWKSSTSPPLLNCLPPRSATRAPRRPPGRSRQLRQDQPHPRRRPRGAHWAKRIRELVRPGVLILDDFAMRQLSAAQADDLYELVSERQGRSLIITSNRAPSDWYPLLPNPVVSESLLDRLINTSHQVIMNGPSYRPNKRPKNPTNKPDEPIT
ncbi:ATP-binding protein [Streptomyces sp. NPDC001817]|uniref:ATP-binding protein n=1 Tax=Streptomyces sp. NPDC001817 TaxID=3154398 RepID=UPI00331A74F9